MPVQCGRIKSCVATLFVVWALAAVQPASAQTQITLDQLYSSVIQHVGGSEDQLSSEDDLFAVPEFLLVWHNADRHQAEALAYLQDPNKTNIGKSLITTAMLNLAAININAYLDFCAKAHDLMKAGKINEKFVRLLIFYNARIVNLDTPSVVKFLATLESRGEFRDAASFLLSGRARTFKRAKNWPIPMPFEPR
jgi:hypothetical protein